LAGGRRSGMRTPFSSTGPAAATATTTARGASTGRSARSYECGGPTSRRRESSLPEDCLFCRLVREGDHVARTDGFVALRDINPKGEIHLLVIPERHVETFRDIDQFPPDEAKRMLVFIADTPRDQGLQAYTVIVNVGEGAGE